MKKYLLISSVAIVLLSSMVAYGMQIDYAKDYYSELGVARTATKDEIKKAYQVLVLKYHPDKPGGSTEKFRAIREAYEVLNDEKARRQYDAGGSLELDMKKTREGYDFLKALKSGDIKAVQEFINSGFDIKNVRGSTALHFAARDRDDNILMMELLHNAGIDIDARDIKDETPLYGAAERGYKHNIEWLLAHGAGANVVTTGGRTPLLNALALAGSFSISDESALHNIIEPLINKKEIDAQDGDGMTALSYAVRNRYLHVVNYLLANGANVNLVDKKGKTPLFYVGGREVVRILEALLDKKADPNIRDNYGETALFSIVRMLRPEDVQLLPEAVQLLIKAGADPSFTDNKYGEKAVDFAKRQLKENKWMLAHDPSLTQAYKDIVEILEIVDKQ